MVRSEFVTPALLNSASILPNGSAAAAITRHPASSNTSALTSVATAPPACTSLAVSWAASA